MASPAILFRRMYPPTCRNRFFGSFLMGTAPTMPPRPSPTATTSYSWPAWKRCTMTGSPHLAIRDWRKFWATAPRLYEMVKELKRLQRQIGITSVYVTHDQAEALEMSDQIAVLKAFGYDNFTVGLHYVGFALVAAFLLLLVTFRSLVIALKAIDPSLSFRRSSAKIGRSSRFNWTAT